MDRTKHRMCGKKLFHGSDQETNRCLSNKMLVLLFLFMVASFHTMLLLFLINVRWDFLYVKHNKIIFLRRA
jgi:hypothetical protein